MVQLKEYETDPKFDELFFVDFNYVFLICRTGANNFSFASSMDLTRILLAVHTSQHKCFTKSV